MNARSYMKEKDREMQIENLCEEMSKCKVGLCNYIHKSFNKGKLIAALLIALPLVVAAVSIRGLGHEEKLPAQDFSLANVPIAAAAGKKDIISIPSGTVKANPFLPYKELSTSSSVLDVPKFDILEPPDFINESSDAARLLDTIVSGILYDKYSPSAILNIEGNDYLVKKGDEINSYKVLNITQDSVTVKLGSNTYKAGIGEILTEGSVNHNDVSNLKNKFGGEKR